MRSFSKSHLADAEIVRGLHAAHSTERGCLVESLAFLAEFQARRLSARTEHPDLRDYCMRVLHLSESAAYKRLRAARAAHRFPQIYEALADGRLHLSAVVALEPRLTPESVDELIAAATHQTRDEVEKMLAERWPRPDVPTALWSVGSVSMPVPLSPGTVAAQEPGSSPALVVLESPRGGDAPLAPGPVVPGVANRPADSAVASTAIWHPPTPPARITPLAPQRFAFQCTLDQETLDLLRRAQELLGHVMPSGEPVAVLKRVLNDWVQAAERRKYGLTDKPRASKPRRPRPGYIPAPIRRAVMKRDGGRCTFVAANGRRCECRKRLEFDHIIPVARGGRTTVENLRLRCRAHNQHEADLVFGAGFMDQRRKAGRQRTASAANGAAAPPT